MPVLPNLIYKFDAIPINTAGGYFVDIDKLILYRDSIKSLYREVKDPEMSL